MEKEYNQTLEPETDLRAPRRYQVLLHNDHYTTWDFVVKVLELIFHKNQTEAEAITNSVHHKGVGVCGEYNLEIAEMKVMQVHSTAKASGYPLRCSIKEV
ncbi:MAG: ATP-dependent Clp protease adaptor ClpS [Helicobacteraceae bacterium]|jgi:ATP-dependent Clp protease adaptor protein ClpS|nr:ATP-dependent Clp protease adaptor ClpS [Helicobacteraceae bacterium]